jgi:hypothetical protein
MKPVKKLLRPVSRDASLPILQGTAQSGALMARFLKTIHASAWPRHDLEPGLAPL